MGQGDKKIKELLTGEEYETLLAFHDIAEEVLGSRLEKIIVFGRTSKKEKTPELDVLFLLSEIDPEDSDEISQIAEDLSENSPTVIAPLVMDEKNYEKYKSLDHPLINDIQSTGVEFK